MSMIHQHTKGVYQTESTETNRFLLVTKVFEEVAQDFEGLDADTLALRGQEFADHPETWETHSHTG